MANLQETRFNGLDLRKIDDVPELYRSVFTGYPHFNVIQSAVYNDVFYTDESAVVSSPTGSGKTVVFELAIIRLLLNWETETVKDYKIVYISPTKALCEERLVDWHKKFSQFGVSCISVTGDSPNVDLSTLINSKLIITTPEKWDSLTRRWRDDERIVRSIKLFMIDEIHLLNDETRGPTLEAIITRMKTIHSSCQVGVKRENSIRLIGVSATISNVVDIAEWFGTSSKPAKYFKFEDSMRPVRLQKIVQGYHYNPANSSPFKFDIMLSYKLHNVLLQHSSGKPSLIFCSTRKSVEMTCKQLIQNITIDISPENKRILVQAADSLNDSKMKETLVHGVACHHAGMLPEDRRTIETLFRDGNLPVLVTTSTLAMGVNLPAHLVVIKSTKYYANGEYKDYNESMLFQMIGRAGRPQFDTSAVAVIMTTAADKKKYENMISGEQPVESYLHKSLAEHVNAEVVLRTITDLSVAMHWLSSTFLYIRARKNPKNYSLSSGLSQAQLDKKLLEICQIEINKLAKAGMLTIDQNVSILPTRVGSLMAKYCVALDTMKLFIQVTGKEVLQQILSLISKCREFSDIRLRTNDKRPLNILNQNRNKRTIRFPLSGRIKTLDMKINCIIQAILGSLEISEPSLLVEGQRIMRVGGRLLNCLSEYFEGKEDYYQALLSSLTLAKCFHARIWENSPYVSRQLEGIGVTLSNALVEAGKTTFKEILNSNPRDLERIINKRPPFGNRIQDQVKMLPQYDLSLKEVVLDDGKITIEIGITLENSAVFESDITVNPDSVMSLLVGDSENKVLLHERYTHMYMIENVRVVRSVDIQTSFAHEVFVHFISDDWVGIDVQRSIKQFVHEEVPSESKTAIPLNTAIVAQEFSDSTKGSIKPQITKIKKTERNTKTKMLQQFMDQYFKKVKSPKRERKTLQKKRSSNVLKRKTSINVAVEPETGSETIILSNELPNKESPVNEAVSDEVVETLNSHETTLTEDKGVTLIHKDEIVTNVVNSSIDLYKQKSACNKGEIPQESGIENDVLPPTPMFRNLKSEQGHLFKSSVRRLTTQRKREFENMRTMELESSIYREDTPKFDFSQYAKEPKKKVGEPTTLESESKNLCPTKAQDNRNTTKLLSWSSPLVISPKLRHSPHLSNNLSENEKNVEKVDAPKQVLSLKNNAKVFSVADKDCSSTGLTDVWSQSFLDYLGITSTKTEDSVRRDTTTSINTADILAQNSLKAIKCDLNQTVSSASSESTNISSAPKINSTTWYTQILKKSLEVKSKCVGSQTEEFMLNTVNDSAVATDRENRQAEINDLHTLKVVSSDKIPEKIEKPTIEYTKANIEPKNIQTQQKSQNVETLFSRNNSWQEEFLSNEPFFDTVTTRQEYLNDNNVKNQIDRRNQRNVNEFDDFNGWSNDIHKDDKVLPQKDLSSSHLDLLDNTQSNVVNNNKYSLLDNSFKRPAFDQRHDFFLKTSRNVYIQPKSDHQIKKRCDEEYWNWLDKEEVTNINDGVSNPSTADYLRSTPNVFDIKISERANENRLHQTCVHCPPNVSFPRPTFKDSWQPKVKHEHLNSYQRQDNNLQRIRPDFNINRPSNYHRKYDFDNNYKHQLYDQQKVIPQVLPNDPCNNEYFFRRNKCLTSRGVSNLPFPTEKQEDFRRPNMPQQYFENSTLLPRPSASPLSENRNQNIGLNTSYIFNETNNKNYQTYPENNFETGYLNTTFIPTCSSKPSELADVEGHTTNKVKRCHSFDRELLPTFMAERDSQVIAYQKNNYPNFTYYAPPRSSEFYENHTELPFKENLNINHENIHHRSFHSSAVDVDNQTKNNFLLSHYFQSRPKPETFHFNRELLNLDHTITSEYIQDIDNNF